MSSIANLLEQADLPWTGAVRWGEPIPCRKSGVYLVSLASRCDQVPAVPPVAPIDRSAVGLWLDRVPGFQLDGLTEPSPDDVVRRLGEFWLQDEGILYIGKTTRPLRKRVSEYYRTELGERRPHRGGHWVKTLTVLHKTYVHYAESRTPEESKRKLLRAFVDGVTAGTKKTLRDPDRPFPFANLEFSKGNRKNHGLNKQAA